MRKLLIISCILFLGINLSAQNPYINPGIFYMPAPGPEKYFADNNGSTRDEDHSWAQYQVNTGVMFNSLNGFNSAHTWLSPSVLLPVGSKFAVSIGGTYVNSYYPGFNDGESGSTSDFIMNVSGIYSLNEKMTVFGSYSKSLMNNGMFGEKGFESMTLGMEFRPLPNVRIGASVTTTNGMNPYYMNSGYFPNRYRPYY